MKKARLASVAAAGALLLGAVTLAPATGMIGASSTAPYPGGSIVYEVDAGGTPRVARYDADGNQTDSIPFVVSKKCQIMNLRTPANPDPEARYVDELLDITIDGDPSKLVLLVENGLGTGDRAGCKTGNGRLANGETLTIGRGSVVEALGLSFTRTDVNVEGKFRADMIWAVDDLDGQIAFGDPGVTPVDLSNSSDNGSDSGGADNEIVPIAPTDPTSGKPKAFDSVSFGPTDDGDGRGEIAIDNGGDSGFASSTRTEFTLGNPVDYEVNCKQAVSETAPNIDQVEKVTFLRLDNGPKYPTCALIGVTIGFIAPGATGSETENGEDRAVAVVNHTFTDASGQNPQDVRARVMIEWRVDRTEVDGDGDTVLRSQAALDAELDREIEYPGQPPVRVDMTYCSDFSGTFGAGTDPDNRFDANAPGVALHPADQPWCLISDERYLVGDEIWQIQILDILGDPRFF